MKFFFQDRKKNKKIDLNLNLQFFDMLLPCLPEKIKAFLRFGYTYGESESLDANVSKLNKNSNWNKKLLSLEWMISDWRSLPDVVFMPG